MESNCLQYHTIQPPKSIADFVQFYWALEGKASASHPFTHRVLADCCPELIFYYKGSFRRYQGGSKEEKVFASGIYGQTARHSTFDAHADFAIFGIYLYPYAFTQLFGLPASELTGGMADLKTFLGRKGEILEEKMMLADNNIQRAKLASDFLESRLKNIQANYFPVMRTIKSIIHSPQVFSVSSLAENCFLSRRQFERKFKEFSGFSPKLFSNIARFNKVIVEEPRSGSLTDTIYEYGYYDHAHFIREFNKFSGYTPKEFFRHLPEGSDYREAKEFKK